MKTILRVLIILLAAGLVVAALVAFSNTELGANILFAGEPSGNQLRQGNGQDIQSSDTALDELNAETAFSGNGNGNGQGQGGGNQYRARDGSGDGQHQSSGFSWFTWLKNLGIIGSLVLVVVIIDTASALIKRRRACLKTQS
jgi:hypothetical protein